MSEASFQRALAQVLLPVNDTDVMEGVARYQAAVWEHGPRGVALLLHECEGLARRPGAPREPVAQCLAMDVAWVTSEVVQRGRGAPTQAPGLTESGFNRRMAIYHRALGATGREREISGFVIPRVRARLNLASPGQTRPPSW